MIRFVFDSENHIYPRKTTLKIRTRPSYRSIGHVTYFDKKILQKGFDTKTNIQYFCGYLNKVPPNRDKPKEMIKTAALLMIITLRLIYQPSEAQTGFAPFSSPTTTTAGISNPAGLLSFNGTLKKNKVVLEWVVSENETADQFEVEKSTDGSHYYTTAFVFGTDLPDTGRYRYSEKAGSKKIMYRVKMIGKDKQSTYSPVITISTNV